ncbi:MAG: 30S ribosomal protein S3ae [Candidatus Lokiarchaeota archaeon]|nr:30S ribosomal protein S3ae [Candidatus Lokiarchaeota archaeon]
MSSRGRKKKAKRGRGRRKVVDAWKSKKWYEVYAPKSFKEAFIGQIPASDENELYNRTIECLLYDFTKNFDHAHIKLRFKIEEIIGTRCNTKFIGHELTRDFIRALIHRGTTRIDGVFNYKTADGFIYRVSAFCVTVRRAKGSQKKSMRKIIYEVLNEFAKSSKHGKFVRGMIYGQFAENIRKIVKTIYPVAECQVRKSKLVSYPEGAIDEEYDEDEVFEEKDVKLKEHGKTVKAKKKARKAAQRAAHQREQQDRVRPEQDEDKDEENGEEESKEAMEEKEEEEVK